MCQIYFVQGHGHQQTTPPKQEVTTPTQSDPPQLPAAAQSPPAQPVHPRGALLKTDVSYEDDSALSQTSSTSGYRENCSLLLMAMESPPHPSTSSSTIVPPSPDSSIGDPSMLIGYEPQDEDTLIQSHCRQDLVRISC